MKNREFFNIYFDCLPKTDTYEQAYEQAEEKHKALTGKRFYKNYQSFKHALSQFYKKK